MKSNYMKSLWWASTWISKLHCCFYQASSENVTQFYVLQTFHLKFHAVDVHVTLGLCYSVYFYLVNVAVSSGHKLTYETQWDNKENWVSKKSSRAVEGKLELMTGIKVLRLASADNNCSEWKQHINKLDMALVSGEYPEPRGNASHACNEKFDRTELTIQARILMKLTVDI